jgi:hypothetical protein
MKQELKAADAVWIATAALQRTAPESDFSVPQIVDRVFVERLTDKPRPTIYLHANQHCVANRPPNPARLRMLLETSSGKRRLYHDGDEYHPLRKDARTLPEAKNIPSRFHPLLDWYRDWSALHKKSWEETDPLMQLYGSGKHIWADEHADEYVRNLREGWE